MIQIFNSWQFNIFAALVLSLGFNQGYKLVAGKSSDDGALTIILQLIAGLSVLVLAPLFKFTFAREPKVYLLFLLAVCFYTINDRLQTTIRKHLEVSVVMILSQLFNVFVVVIGLLIFREPLVWLRLLGAGLILGANVYLFYQRGQFDFNRYFVFAIIANLALAIAVSTDIGLSRLFNLPLYIAVTLIFPPVLIKLSERIPLKDIWQEYQRANKKWLCFTAVSWGLMIFFFLRAFLFGPITLLVPLWSTSVLLNVLVAFLWFRERDELRKKIIAALMVMGGIYLTIAS